MIMQKINYGTQVRVKGKFEEIQKGLELSLKEEGFGVLSTIDIQGKIEEKLNKKMPRHIILGACNPSLAYKALEAEHNISLLLPCNVILYEGDGFTPESEDGYVTIAAIKPSVAMSMVENEALSCIAQEVDEKLYKVIKGMAANT